MKRLSTLMLVLCCPVFGCDGAQDLPQDASGPISDTDFSAPDLSQTDAARSDATAPIRDAGNDGAFSGDGADAASGITFRITSPRSDRPVGYRLAVALEPQRVQDGTRYAAEESDTIVDETERWLITGETGTAASSTEVHGDTFRWATVEEPQFGIVGWFADAPFADYTITINGVEIDPASLPELPEPSSETGCLGGGACYGAKVTANDAAVVVGATATLEDLRAALAAASSGDVIFIDSAAEIDLGFFSNAPSIEVPAGVTLASDRGVNGSQGARLFGGKKPGTAWIGSDTIKVNDNVRITGLRIEGPEPDRDMNWLDEKHDYTDGIEAAGTSDVEIDNNEIYGWPAAAIHGGDPIHIHHNYIHDNDQSGLGYGVSVTKWPSIIEYNDFRWNRHAIAGAGYVGDGFIARHNVFGAEGINGAGHKIDMHEDPDNPGNAGSRMEIYKNTIMFPNAQGVYLRATPRESAEIYENWIFNPTPPCLTKDRSGSYCSIEVNANDWTNVSFRDNHYGSSEPDCEIGGPREGC